MFRGSPLDRHRGAATAARKRGREDPAAPLRMLPPLRFTRPLLQTPTHAECVQHHVSGVSVEDVMTFRQWVYGLRFGIWCWILVRTRTGKRLGFDR